MERTSWKNGTIASEAKREAVKEEWGSPSRCNDRGLSGWIAVDEKKE